MSDQPIGAVEDVLPHARKLKRPAVQQVLAAYYPRVSRVAMGLTGTEATGRRVTELVMRQSLNTLPWWSSEADAANWFLHHTVLVSREVLGDAPDISRDVLVTTVKAPSPEHVAFVKAFRNLPAQQREAFLLMRGEHLDGRTVGVAMDCSMGAAANHRIAAEKSLAAIAAQTFEERCAELGRVYASLTPTQPLILGNVARVVRRLQWRRIGKIVRRLIILAIIAAIAYVIWRAWGHVEV